jgi:hypothetical protein
LVTQAASAARWLAGLEMGLAIGVALCLSELTMIFAAWMLPLAATDYGVGQSLVLGIIHFFLLSFSFYSFYYYNL